jgi:hypothetical protein
MIDESRRLHDHVLRMDALIYGGKLEGRHDNPVEHQPGSARRVRGQAQRLKRKSPHRAGAWNIAAARRFSS